MHFKFGLTLIILIEIIIVFATFATNKSQNSPILAINGTQQWSPKTARVKNQSRTIFNFRPNCNPGQVYSSDFKKCSDSVK